MPKRVMVAAQIQKNKGNGSQLESLGGGSGSCRYARKGGGEALQERAELRSRVAGTMGSPILKGRAMAFSAGGGTRGVSGAGNYCPAVQNYNKHGKFLFGVLLNLRRG